MKPQIVTIQDIVIGSKYTDSTNTYTVLAVDFQNSRVVMGLRYEGLVFRYPINMDTLDKVFKLVTDSPRLSCECGAIRAGTTLHSHWCPLTS